MTKNNKFKKQVRALAEAEGISYTAARERILKQRELDAKHPRLFNEGRSIPVERPAFVMGEIEKIGTERPELADAMIAAVARPYPAGWPTCPGCGKPALDGHITCGDVRCDKGGRR